MSTATDALIPTRGPGAVMNHPPATLDVYVMDMLRSLSAGAQHSALALALALPDICGSIEYPTERKVGVRYANWCNTWGKMLAVSGADCYALRCAYLHNGSEEFSGPAAVAALFERIHFTIGQVEGVWKSQALPAEALGAKQTARIPVETFCRDMATSVDAWCRAHDSDERVAEAIAGLMWMRPAS